MTCFAISWNGIPHTDLSLPQGKWKFDKNESFGAMIFQMIKTARDMGITLHEFLKLPQDEKALQLSYSNLKSKMEHIDAQDRQDQMKRKAKK